MGSDPVEINLAVVEAHIRDEARDPASVMALYTDDIVQEMPSRGLVLTGKAAIQANYEAMFASMAEVEITPIERFATPVRVVDDCIVRFRLTGDGVANAPVAVGTRVEMRLLHLFHMTGGKIAREEVFEAWRALD
jgi:ketosteroid isomerase-like protein